MSHPVWKTSAAALGKAIRLAAIALLVLVLLPGIGREVNGAKRWIGFGAFNIQPSEIAKVFVVLYLAGYLVRRQEEVRESWAGFFKPFVVLLPMAFLLLLEPDFGATVVMMGSAMANACRREIQSLWSCTPRDTLRITAAFSILRKATSIAAISCGSVERS